MEYIANVAILLVVCFLVYSVFKSQSFSNKHDKAMHKMDLALQRQEKNAQLLNQMLQEMRRSNQYLAELVGMEDIEQEAGASADMSANIDTTANDLELQAKVYVGNIDYAATESELSEYFSQYGRVESVNIPLNRYTGKARGFGFVTFASQQEAEQAMALNGSEFKGRQIQVNFAKEREKA